MFGWLYNFIIGWLAGVWEKAPDTVKEDIINTIVDIFETILREYFRSKKQEKESSNE